MRISLDERATFHNFVMALNSSDPNTSELLAEFDIADVVNWDDQNDASKVG